MDRSHAYGNGQHYGEQQEKATPVGAKTPALVVSMAVFFYHPLISVTLSIWGDVESGSSAKLLSAITQNRDVKYIALGSRGESVAEAFEIPANCALTWRPEAPFREKPPEAT